jgi:hypothetical protein
MRMATNMINPGEKLKALLIKMRHINELLERKMKTTEEDEKQYLQEEIEKNTDGNETGYQRRQSCRC